MPLNSKIIDIIACPICKGKLIYDKTEQELICNFDKLAFPIKNNIPIMIIDRARKYRPCV
jgi:uncharacterized protein